VICSVGCAFGVGGALGGRRRSVVGGALAVWPVLAPLGPVPRAAAIRAIVAE
jgi:hypothetical protein